jgi:hypothetical protein
MHPADLPRVSLADAFTARHHHTLTTPCSLAECQRRIGPESGVFGLDRSDPRPFWVAWQGPDRVRLTLTGLRAREMRRELRVQLIPSDRGTTIDAVTQISPIQNALVLFVGCVFFMIFGGILGASIAQGAHAGALFPLPLVALLPVVVYTALRAKTARQVDALLHNLEFVLGASPYAAGVTPLVTRTATRAFARQPLAAVPSAVPPRPTFVERVCEQRRFALTSALPVDECRRRIDASAIFNVRTANNGDLLVTRTGSRRSGAYELRIALAPSGAHTTIEAVGRQRGALTGLLLPWAPMIAVLLALGAPHGAQGLVAVSPFMAVPVLGAIVTYAVARFLPCSQHNFLPAALVSLLDARAVAA